MRAIVIAAIGTAAISFEANSQGIYKITEPTHNSVISNASEVGVSWIIDSYATDRRGGFSFWIGCGVLGPDGNVISIRPTTYVSASRGRAVISIEDTRRYDRHNGVAAILLLRVDDRGNERYLSWLQQGGRPGLIALADVNPSVFSRVIVKFGDAELELQRIRLPERSMEQPAAKSR